MYDAATIFAIVGTFLIAGTVKGIIGLGLPTLSVALLTVAIDLPSAMALLLVPSFAPTCGKRWSVATVESS